MNNRYFIKRDSETNLLNRLSEEELLNNIRVIAHQADKIMQCENGKPEELPDKLGKMISIYEQKYNTEKNDFIWSKKIHALFNDYLNNNNFEYPWERNVRINITESEFEKLIKTRRSIRKFIKKDIENEILIKIIEFGQYAPTTCNQQSIKYLITKKFEMLKEINHGSLKGENAPCIIAVIADLRFYSDNDIETPMHDSGAAIQNILLSCHFYNIGACYVSDLGVNTAKYRKIFNVNEYEKITAFIFIGYYELSPIKPERRNINEVIKIF